MARVLILGAGAMGTAICYPLADAGHEIRLVGTHLDTGWITSIRQSGIHPRLRTNIPKSVTSFTHPELAKAWDQGNDLIILGVNAAGIPWAIDQLGAILKGPAPVLLLTKGLEARGGSLRILTQTVYEGLAERGVKGVPVAAVCGPCIAGELAARRETRVVVGSADPALLKSVLPLLTTPYFHPDAGTDVVGLEACAALKNLYAIGVGYASGRYTQDNKATNGALMFNLAAGIFAQALLEIGHLVGFLGGTQPSVAGLAGAGDLYVTAQTGRNSRLGFYLGTGLRYSKVKKQHMAEETVEGAELALAIGPTIEGLIANQRLDPSAIPLGRAILSAVCEDAPMKIPWVT